MFSFYYLEFSIFFLELYKGIYSPDLKSNLLEFADQNGHDIVICQKSRFTWRPLQIQCPLRINQDNS